MRGAAAAAAAVSIPVMVITPTLTVDPSHTLVILETDIGIVNKTRPSISDDQLV